MPAEHARRSSFAAVFVPAIMACSSPLRNNQDARDAKANASDLALASEPPADRNPVWEDAAADAGSVVADVGPDTPALGDDSGSVDRWDLAIDTGPDTPVPGLDGAGPDGPPVINPDAGLDAGLVRKDSAGVDQGAGLDGGRPLPCTGPLVYGSFLPMRRTGGAVTAGDLDGDGTLDLVTTSDDGDAVSVLVGKGDGTFSAGVDYATGKRPQRLLLGDVNADGKLDVVTANQGGTVSVLLGQGDGTLAAKQDYSCGREPQAVAMADFDGDGKPDLVTVSSSDNTVSVLLGKGDGTFAAKLDYAVGRSPYSVLIGDLNGDRAPDLVVSERDDSVSVLLGKGDGTFADKPDHVLALVFSNTAAALDDVNGDGKQDLLIASGTAGAVLVFFGQGDGTFAAPPVFYPVSGGAGSMVLSDVNGDGKADIVLGPGRVLLGLGDGTFAAEVDSPPAGVAGLSVVAVGDFTGDGKLDILGTSSNWVGVLVGSGEGTFGVGTSSLPAGGYPNSLALGDLDHDGNLDIVTAKGAAGTIGALLGKGDGTFAANTDFAAGNGLSSIVLGDLDGDGKLDVAGVNGTTVGVLLGRGDGSFGAAAFHDTTAELVTALALGDVNGDGKLDVVTANSQGHGETGYRGTVSVLLGTGSGKLATHVDYAVGDDPEGVALGDVNGDGKLDIVVANTGVDFDWSVGVLLGKGDGTFSGEAEISGGLGPNAVALGDLNGDGKLDAVLINTMAAGGDTAAILLGKGDGTLLGAPGYSLTSGNARSLVLADLNGDGALDIVTVGDNPSMLTVLFGKGDGTFPSSAGYGVETSAVAFRDLNGDGRLDLVTTARDGVNVLLASCR